MGKRKVSLVLGSIIFIVASTSLSYYFFIRPRFEQKMLVNPQCPKESNVVAADPDEFTYNSDNIKRVVGNINLDPKLVKGIEYDLIGYAGGVGYATDFWVTSRENKWDKYDSRWVDHAGWKKIDLNSKKSPVTFSIEPKLPDKINKFNIIDISIVAVCKDGSMSFQTVVGFLRHPYPNLYFVTSSNPRKIKYL